MNAVRVAPYAPPTAVDDPALLARSGERFRVREVLRAAWQSYWSQPGRASIAITLAFVLPAAFSYAFATWMAGVTEVPGLVRTFGPQLFSFLTWTFFSIGSTRVALAAARGERIRFATIVGGVDVIASAIGSVWLVDTCIFIGTVLFIVPGVIMAMASWCAPWLVADRGTPALQSFEESLRVTRGSRWRLAMLELVCGLLVLAGVLCLGVGLLVALPVASFARAHAYLRLTGEVLPTE